MLSKMLLSSPPLRRSRSVRLLAAAACLASLAACSSLDGASSRILSGVTPYKADVVQGNFVSKEQLDAIRTGMPRAQVRDILGSPLVTSAFHGDRWDYVFTIRRQGAQPQERKLTVLFKGDEVLRVEAGAVPTEAQLLATLGTSRSLGKVPVLEVPSEALKASDLHVQEKKEALPRTNIAQFAPSFVAPAYPPLEAPGTTASAWDAATQR